MKNLVKALADEKVICSFAEGRRLIGQGAVKVNDQVVTDIAAAVSGGDEVKIGKKQKVIIKDEES